MDGRDSSKWSTPGSTNGYFDWQTPTAQIWGLQLPENSEGKIEETICRERWKKLREIKTLICPENQYVAVPYTVADSSSFNPSTWPTVKMNSYVGAMIFHLKNSSTDARSGVTVGRTDWNPPEGYGPKLSKIGNSSMKVYVADGARYSSSRGYIDYSVSPYSTYGGQFMDQGAASRYSHSWDRSMSPGNDKNTSGSGDDQGSGGTLGSFDARLYAYRHGKTDAGGAADSMKMNLSFFDGHVELMGDLQSSDPKLWAPSGTQFNYGTGGSGQDQMHKDAKARYFGSESASGTYEVP